MPNLAKVQTVCYSCLAIYCCFSHALYLNSVSQHDKSWMQILTLHLLTVSIWRSCDWGWLSNAFCYSWCGHRKSHGKSCVGNVGLEFIGRKETNLNQTKLLAQQGITIWQEHRWQGARVPNEGLSIGHFEIIPLVRSRYFTTISFCGLN
jgi:hypothetical protein